MSKDLKEIKGFKNTDAARIYTEGVIARHMQGPRPKKVPAPDKTKAPVPQK